ncbi:MAG: alpha-galactosidase, partial [Thermomicrobiales bacterium]|nr:alpha-galactosidase [Thermomicrobiales bacterium]
DERLWNLRSWNTQEGEWSVQLDIDSELTTSSGVLVVTESIWLACDLPVLRRWVRVRNEGAELVEIGRYHMLDLVFDCDPAVAPLDLLSVDAFAGHRKDRWEPGDANFALRERTLLAGDAVRLGVGAYQEGCAWLALAREGAGVAAGLEYDGAAEFRVFDAVRTAGAERWGKRESARRGVRLVAAPIDDVNVRLGPGEEWRSPGAFVALFEDGWDAAAQVTHALVERHLAPAPPDDDFPYVMFNSWGYAWDLDPGSLLRCLDLAAEIGVEVFVADYGWARDVGDWVAVGERMPPLPELRQLVHERGMKLGAWMGFANAGVDSPVLREHPDWRVYPNDWGSLKSRALCLAEPVVREWVTAEVIRVVHEYGLDYLVHDFELITPCTHPKHLHAPDPGGYHSAEGYNEVLRRVRAAHPRLVIENCQGGGRMMTYAMVQLHDTSITSDGPVLRDALARRQALYGASYPFPLRFCDNYMEERPTDMACHSSMIGGPWILMDQMTAWGVDDIATAKRNIALYKRIRPRFRDARVYHLRKPDGAGWDGLQVHQPGTDSGVVFLFQPAGAQGEQFVLRLFGLEPERGYRVTSGVSGERWEVLGERLMGVGLGRTMGAGVSDVLLVDPV